MVTTASQPPTSSIAAASARGGYRPAPDRNLPGGRSIARADVADLMLRLAGRHEAIGHTVGVAY